MLTLGSCKEDTIIKSSLTPAVDNIHTFGIGPDFNNGSDTITMLTSTVFQDSVITSTRGNGFPIYHALGYTKDPFAGTTAASIYMQFVPTTANLTLAQTPDSLVLILPYAGFTWGDTSVQQTHNIKVYTINEGFSKDSTFYSYSSKSTDATLAGTATLVTGKYNTGGVQDSVAVGKNARFKAAPHLRIRLTDAFRDRFKALLAADSTYPAFVTQFPGLYIMADSGMSAASLPYFRLNGGAEVYGSASLLAYTPGNDSTPIQFPYLETYAAHFNRIRRNYTGYPIAGLLSGGTQQTVAMQNAPGAAIDLQLPFIQSLPRNVIINKAEIAFVQVPTVYDDAKFFPPARIYAQGINSTGGQYTIADRYPINDQSLNFIDGTPSAATKGGTAVTVYRLNIPREVQQAIVAGSSGLHLRIGGTVNFPAAYRVVLGSRGNSNVIYRPTINIIYSKQ